MKLNEDVTVPRGKLVELIRFADNLQERYGFPVACFGHAGDGNIHVNVMVAEPDRIGVGEKMEQALDDLFQLCDQPPAARLPVSTDRIGEKALVDLKQSHPSRSRCIRQSSALSTPLGF